MARRALRRLRSGLGEGNVVGASGGTVAGDVAGNAVSDTLGGTLISNVALGLAGR
jgi:filamentous hemagglutinin